MKEQWSRANNQEWRKPLATLHNRLLFAPFLTAMAAGRGNNREPLIQHGGHSELRETDPHMPACLCKPGLGILRQGDCPEVEASLY